MTGGNQSQVETLPRQLVAGLIVGIFGVSVALALATMIFVGDLAPSLGRGTGWLLAGYVIFGLVTALTSSFRGIVAGPQDAPAVLVAAAAAGIAATAVEPLATLATFIILTTAITGALLVLMGRSRLGDMVRYVPFPVVAGFLAGTGLLLLVAGIGQLLGPTVGAVEVWLKMVPAIALGVSMAVLGIRGSSPTISVGLIVFCLVGYHIAAAVAGVAGAEGQARGLVLGPFPEGQLADPGVIAEMAAADWGAILGQGPVLLAMLAIVPIALLLNLGGLEQEFDVDLDVDRDLRSTGLGMLAAAPFAAIPGYLYLSVTMVGRRLGGAGRVAALAGVGVAALVLLAGANLATLVPVIVPAGVLIGIGLALLWSWAWAVRTRVTSVEHMIILQIVLVIGLFGFLPGVGVGVVAATCLFAVRYARTSAVRTLSTMSERRSNVQRMAREEVLLSELGTRVLVLELQGYLFFGTTEQVLRSTRRAIDAAREIEVVVIDLRRVTGMDSSATSSFDRLSRLADSRGFRVVICGAGGEAPTSLVPLISHELVRYVPDLDRALEAVEDELLGAIQDRSPEEEFDWSDTPRLVVGVGQPIITEGESGVGIFYLESGRAMVDAPDPGARRAVLLPGTVIGELSHLTGNPAMATVVSETECVVRHMSPEWLAEVARRDPQRALAIERLISHRLAVKLTAANRTIGSLQ